MEFPSICKLIELLTSLGAYMFSTVSYSSVVFIMNFSANLTIPLDATLVLVSIFFVPLTQRMLNFD